MTNVTTSGRGNFFAIDRRAWAHAHRTVDINSMVAYLVQARGTGGDQRTSKWSRRSIETHTGIGRKRAQDAIDALVRGGLVQITSMRPRKYRIVPAHEVPGCEGYPPPKRKGSTPSVDEAEAAAKADWIWLPNTIVDGAAGETAPVELVRQTQSAATLRLLIDIYHSQNLASDGGLHWRSIRQAFTRHTIGQRGPFIVYGFEGGASQAWEDQPFVRPHMTGKVEAIAGSDRKRDCGWPAFWVAWNRLVSLGLVEMVGHLIEADNNTAALIHPYAISNGEASERRLADAAHAAGEAMLTEDQRTRAEASGLHLAPVMAHITEVQMVGIARLRYRPRTGATAAWLARTAEWKGLVARYDEAAAEARRA